MHTQHAVAPSIPLDDPRREVIIRHARQSFLVQGYAATRMESIAREAAVSTATLYLCYPSKAELFSAVMTAASVDLSQHLSLMKEYSGSARMRLSKMMGDYALFLSDPEVRSILRVLVAEQPVFPHLSKGSIERGRLAFGAPLISHLEDLKALGELVFDKASWAAGQLMGMIEHTMLIAPLAAGIISPSTRTPEDVAADAVETFLARYGVKGSKAV